MQRSFIALALIVIAAACGGGDAAPADDAATPSTSSSTGTTEAVGSTTAATTASSTQPAAPVTTVVPALGITGSASDTFDEDHLVGGAGSRFVPMDDPVMVAASTVTWLDPDDIVMGTVRGDEAHAFPVNQMAWHHIANTTIAGEPYLVTY